MTLDVKRWKPLTHWSRVTHICVGKLTIIVPDDDLSPERRQVIIWTNAWMSLIRPIGTNFSEILIKIDTFSCKKIYLKLSSGKWRPFCLGLNVLRWHSIALTLWCERVRIRNRINLKISLFYYLIPGVTFDAKRWKPLEVTLDDTTRPQMYCKRSIDPFVQSTSQRNWLVGWDEVTSHCVWSNNFLSVVLCWHAII